MIVLTQKFSCTTATPTRRGPNKSSTSRTAGRCRSKGGCIADPRQAHQPWELDEQVQQGSNHHAPCDPIDAHARRQHQNAKDHSQRVHDRRQSGVKKLLVGVQDPHHQPAHAKDDWREQLNAQQMNGQSPAEPGR